MPTKEQCIAVNDILVQITGQRISPTDIVRIQKILASKPDDTAIETFVYPEVCK